MDGCPTPARASDTTAVRSCGIAACGTAPHPVPRLPAMNTSSSYSNSSTSTRTSSSWLCELKPQRPPHRHARIRPSGPLRRLIWGLSRPSPSPTPVRAGAPARTGVGEGQIRPLPLAFVVGLSHLPSPGKTDFQSVLPVGKPISYPSLPWENQFPIRYPRKRCESSLRDRA